MMNEGICIHTLKTSNEDGSHKITSKFREKYFITYSDDGKEVKLEMRACFPLEDEWKAIHMCGVHVSYGFGDDRSVFRRNTYLCEKHYYHNRSLFLKHNSVLSFAFCEHNEERESYLIHK